MQSVPPNDDHNIPEGELLFTVSDTGDGIPDNDLPHIFERNFSGGRRIDPQAEALPGGGCSSASHQSGLGLYISQQIVKQHSGTMLAQNNAWGGAEISFTLPCYT